MTVNKLSTLKIAAAAALLIAPAMLTSPAAADTDAPKASQHTTHRARAHVRSSYASAPAATPFTIGDEPGNAGHSYHCGIGLYNTPLPCERDN